MISLPTSLPKLVSAAIIWASCLLMCVHAQQPQHIQDVLYLKDGSIIRGRLISYEATGKVRIEIIGENVLVFDTEDIARRAFEAKPTENRSRMERLPVKYKYRGYYNLTQLGMLLHNPNNSQYNPQESPQSFNLQMINGYRFNRFVQTGLGLGLNFFQRGYTLPIFAELRGDILKSEITPHYYFSGGYSIPLYNGDDLYWEEANPEIVGGLLADAGVGVKINTPGQVSWVLTAGYRIQQSEHRYTDPWSQARIVEAYTHRRLSVQLGMMF